MAGRVISPSTTCHWTVQLFVWSVFKLVSDFVNLVWLRHARQLYRDRDVKSAAMNLDLVVLPLQAVSLWLLCQSICILAQTLAPCLFVLGQYVYFNQRAYTPAPLIESPPSPPIIHPHPTHTQSDTHTCLAKIRYTVRRLISARCYITAF